jgi:hypothetical protein
VLREGDSRGSGASLGGGRVAEADVPADGRGGNLGAGAIGEDDLAGNSTLPTSSSSPTKTVPDDANAAFARAQDTFNSYRLRGDEAETLTRWGHFMTGAGSALEARDKLGEAEEIYRAYGADDRWSSAIAIERGCISPT